MNVPYILYIAGVLAGVERTCGALSKEDGCEDDGRVDQSGWLVYRTCTCTGSNCNTDSGVCGATYTASLTMISVMMAVLAFWS